MPRAYLTLVERTSSCEQAKTIELITQARQLKAATIKIITQLWSKKKQQPPVDVKAHLKAHSHDAWTLFYKGFGGGVIFDVCGTHRQVQEPICFYSYPECDEAPLMWPVPLQKDCTWFQQDNHMLTQHLEVERGSAAKQSVCVFPAYSLRS